MSHFTKDENSRRFVENLNYWLNYKEDQKVAYNNLYRLCDYLENKLKEINPEKYKTFISENGIFEKFNVNLAILIVNAITGKNEIELLLNELFKRIIISADLLGFIKVDSIPGYSAPDYGAPDYGTLGYGAPDYGTLGYGAPDYGTLGYGAPDYGTLGYGAPDYGTLGYGAPYYGTLGYGAPISDIIKDIFGNNLFYENKWDIFKSRFIEQFEKYSKTFDLNENYDILVNNELSGIDKISKYYTEKYLKRLDNYDRYKDKDNRIKVFSVSLFLKPGAKFKNRDIQLGGNKDNISFDDYINPIENKDIYQKIKILQDNDLKRDILTYFEILFKNIKLYQENMPNWVIRLYLDKSISESDNEIISKYFNLLKTKDIEIIESSFISDNIQIEKGHKGIATMCARFLPMFDTNVSKFLTIEADNWPTTSYFNIIKKWDDEDSHLCISFISANNYGWPSGLIENDKLHYFEQNYGGMFGLNKENNKNYNPKIFEDLYLLARKRLEIFNNNLFNDDNTPKFEREFWGLLKNKISSLLDFGIDEVWLSLSILPRLENYKKNSIYAIPVFGEELNFNYLDLEDKTKIVEKLKLNKKILTLNNQGIKQLFRYINFQNRSISTAIEIAIVEEVLNIKDYKLGIKKNYNLLPTFINLYPGWNYSNNYDQILKLLNEIENNSFSLDNNNFMLKNKYFNKYLKYKNKYLKLKKLN